MKFSANLGFLWTDRPLPEAIRAAKSAGFDAVECHWPYDVDAAIIKRALDETGLSMLGLNTRRGNVEAGENGLAALPGRSADARQVIDEAVDYASATGTTSIHVMAGFARGADAHATFVENLAYACRKAEPHGISILIEPLNGYDALGYFLNSVAQARRVIEEVDADNLKLMFDCYHIQLLEGDISHRLADSLDIIGHIQFASVPDRGAPDHGELNYSHVFSEIERLGWETPLGAEYKPGGDTDATLDWLSNAR